MLVFVVINDLFPPFPAAEWRRLAETIKAEALKICQSLLYGSGNFPISNTPLAAGIS